MYTAMILSYVTSQRYSNILALTTESWTHAVMSHDIVFVIKDTDVVIRGLAAYLRILVGFENVVGVLITIRNAKNDQEGVGHRYHYTREVVIPDKRVFDITTDLWNYVKVAKPIRHRL